MAWWIKGLARFLLGIFLAVAAVWSWSAGLNSYWPFLRAAFAAFSLFRGYKAFVEMWRSRLGEMVEIQVSAEKDTYLPGDVVNVSVRVTGKEELDIEECRVALVCTNRYVYEYTTTDSDGDQVYPGRYGGGRGCRRAHP